MPAADNATGKAIVPPKCPYCGTEAKSVDSKVIYKNKSYGPAWVCGNYPKCDAYVGCHPDGKPLGRLADKELRVAKTAAHLLFDVLWREKSKQFKIPEKEARTKAYAWLASQLKINKTDCHIGHFDVAACKKVAAICEPYARKYITSGEKR